MIAILFALVSYFGWGSGDIFGTFATRKIGAFATSFWIYLLGLIIVSAYIPFAWKELSNFTPEVLAVNVAVALLLAICFLGFNEALRIGNASIVGTVAGSFSGVTVLLSLIFFGEKLSIYQVLAILLILLGVVLSSLHIGDIRGKKILSDKGTLIAILVMIGWGIGFTFIRIPIDKVGWFWSTYLLDLVGILFFVVVGFRKIRKAFSVSRKGITNSLAAASLQNIGTFGFNYALSLGATSIVAPIGGSYTTLFVLLSRFAFKDRLTKQQWIGIIVTLIGIVLLAFLSR